MDIWKYVILIIPFFILILEKFIRKNKEEVPPYKKFSKGGWIIFSLGIITFLIGIFKTYYDEQQAIFSKSLADQKRESDSILLLRRWEYDTSKFNQLLDSSTTIIANSLANIEKSNKNLRISDSLLRTAQLQGISIDKNIDLTNKLSYPLPDSISYRFRVRFTLDREKCSDFIRYLDSLTVGEENKQYTLSNGSKDINFSSLFHIQHIGIRHNMWKEILLIAQYFLAAQISFQTKSETILILKSISWENSFRMNDIRILYFRDNKHLIIETRSNKTFQTLQYRNLNSFSLLDLNHKDMVIQSIGVGYIPNGLAFDWLEITLDINKKWHFFTDFKIKRKDLPKETKDYIIRERVNWWPVFFYKNDVRIREMF